MLRITCIRLQWKVSKKNLTNIKSGGQKGELPHSKVQDEMITNPTKESTEKNDQL